MQVETAIGLAWACAYLVIILNTLDYPNLVTVVVVFLVALRAGFLLRLVAGMVPR